MTKLQPELIVSYKAFTGERDGLVIGKALV